jgi:hypothetical protein
MLLGYNSASINQFIESFKSESSMFFFILISILLFIYQYNRLYFYVISINDKNNREIENAISASAESLDWKNVIKHNDTHYTARSRGIFSWGELITITWSIENECLYINSICDPYLRPAITSGGKNRKNVLVMKKMLEKKSAPVRRSVPIAKQKK